ncbi:hypothetical protein WDU94_002220 [Cyamophila willieti]
MADEEKRQQKKMEEESRMKQKRLFLMDEGNKENVGERVNNADKEPEFGHVNYTQLEGGVNGNCVQNAKEKAFDDQQKACKHMKETIPVGVNNGNHFLDKQGAQPIRILENGYAKKDGIGNIELRQEAVQNGNHVANRVAIGSNNNKKVCFMEETAVLVGNATERDIQGVLEQGSDVSNNANNTRIEEESPVVTEIEVRKSSTPNEDFGQVSKFTKPIRDLIEFSLNELEQATNGFNEEPRTRKLTGNKLGEGAYGAVYYGKLTSGTEVAVKTLQREPQMTTSSIYSTSEEQEDPVAILFRNEVRNLAVCKHPNLVRLLGYHVGDMSCIVYEYMANGSLYDRLACKENTPPLTADTRWSIALDVAEALNYLHTGLPTAVIHRDVKSMNILLNDRLEAKLADFGIVREMSVQRTIHTRNIAGTNPYMAPEAHQGSISVKIDVFAYGIVLLEILTGLNHNSILDGRSLWTYFVGDRSTEEEGINLVKEHLDEKANWDNAVLVDTLVDTAYKRCCNIDKNKRESMSEIVNRLRALKS